MFNELDAVNRILRILGEQPVNQINEFEESSIAHDILLERKRTILSEGWFFNIDEDFLLIRDSNGFINIPTNTLKIDTVRNKDKWPVKAVVRGDRLYDKVNNTFIWETDLYCDITIDLDFNDLITQAKDYITISAAMTYSNNLDGSSTIYKLNQAELERALMKLESIEIETQELVSLGNHQIYSKRNKRF